MCYVIGNFLANFLTYTILFKYNSGCPSRGGEEGSGKTDTSGHSVFRTRGRKIAKKAGRPLCMGRGPQL